MSEYTRDTQEAERKLREEAGLVGAEGTNWQGIAISLLVILGVCGIIALAILLLTPHGSKSGAYGDPFTIQDLLSGEFTPRTFNGTWVSDNQMVFRDPEGDLVQFSASTRKSIRLMSNASLSELGTSSYAISADLRYVLLAYDTQKVYIHSHLSRYKIYNITSRQVIPLEHTPGDQERMRLAMWGPRDNQVVYEHLGNLYYKEDLHSQPAPITLNGVVGSVYAGVPDWLYEVEILHSGSAVWWAPDGTWICFSLTNSTKVGTHSYVWYGDGLLYPEVHTVKYPKAGGENPAVSLWVADLRNPSKIVLKDVKPPRNVKHPTAQVWDHYYGAVAWVDNQCLSVTWLTRVQNYSVVTLCCMPLWYCDVVLEQKARGRGWVDLQGPPVFGAGRTKWFLKQPLVEGSLGHFQHLAAVSNVALQNTEPRKMEYFTQGPYDITEVLAYHPPTNKVYYLSTREGRPGERHLYYLYDQRVFRVPVCVTCGVTGPSCLSAKATFSPTADFYVLECLGPRVPTVELWSTANDTLLMRLDGNLDLEERLKFKAKPKVRTFAVPISSGYKFQVRLFLPPGQDDDEALVYPMVMQAPGGPGGQLVNERWGLHWGAHLASQLGYIYAQVDGRGSGGQGDKMRHEVYRRLGTVEVADQIEVAKYLKINLPFISASHVAIWGWGYGGFVTLSALAAQSEPVFRCGAAVAPVASWQHYSSAYAERYMGTLSDNFLGYEASSLLKKAVMLRGQRLLIAHGTADEQVPFQHASMLMKALADAGVVFKSQVYPDSTHDLSDVLPHLYRTLEDFLGACFMSESEDDVVRATLDLSR